VFVKLSSKREFGENRFTKSRAFLNTVNEVLPVLSAFLYRSEFKSVQNASN